MCCYYFLFFDAYFTLNEALIYMRTLVWNILSNKPVKSGLCWEIGSNNYPNNETITKPAKIRNNKRIKTYSPQTNSSYPKWDMVVIPRSCGQGELMDVHTFCLVSMYSMVFEHEWRKVYPPEKHKWFINQGLSKKRRNIKKGMKDLTTNKYLCIYRRNTTQESSVVHAPSICPSFCWKIEWLHRR